MADKYEKLDWEEITPITQRTVSALELHPEWLRWLLLHEGCFLFRDGTTQGWTLEQLFDPYNGDTPLKILTGFTLSNSQNRALAAAASPLTVRDKGITACGIYLLSPDLTKEEAWQGIKGYRLALQANWLSPCYLVHKGYKFQMQVVLTDPKGKDHTFAEAHAGQFVMHDIKPNLPHQFEWTLTQAGQPGWKVKHLRLRMITPYVHSYECGMYGKWLVGEICPVR
ncbi:MAG TPA: hypothetical protein ENJ38_11045 [Rhodospirillales bacterium]|nr:hypothetical protein [Rhodospirillales bacterium]